MNGATNPKKGRYTMKVNLKDIQDKLVKRGRDAFQDEILEAELLALDPNTEGDAFIYEAGQGNPNASDYVAHKNKVRGRVASVAGRYSLKVSIQWLTTGECVVTLA
jgi:hypothetical protein